MDRVEYDLNEYMKGIDKAEIALDNFTKEVQEYLSVISEMAVAIKEIEAKYPDYDFEDEVKQMIEDVL